VATARKKYEQPFNRKIPPLFQKGGLIYKQRQIGAKIALMVEMPEENFTARDWRSVYEGAKRELMDICFLENRCASYAELSQLDWLSEAGHKLWWLDEFRPPCNLNHQLEKLRKEIDDLKTQLALVSAKATIKELRKQVREGSRG
jgi:hypothetical protein